MDLFESGSQLMELFKCYGHGSDLTVEPGVPMSPIEWTSDSYDPTCLTPSDRENGRVPHLAHEFGRKLLFLDPFAVGFHLGQSDTSVVSCKPIDPLTFIDRTAVGDQGVHQVARFWRLHFGKVGQGKDLMVDQVFQEILVVSTDKIHGQGG